METKLCCNSSVNYLHLFLCIFCISWLNGGFFAMFGIVKFVVFISVFICWILIADRDNKYFQKYLLSNVWLYIYSVMVFISSLFIEQFWNKYSYNCVYLIIIMAFAVYYYDDKRKQEQKIIVAFYLIENIAISLKTLYITIADQNYVRNLAAGVEERYSSASALVAKFANVYAFVLIAVLIACVFKRSKNKILLTVTEIALCICIFRANFATAIFVGAIFLALTFLVKKPKYIVAILIFAVLIYSLTSKNIANFCNIMSKQQWVGEFLSFKFKNIADTINGSTVGQVNNTLNMRIDYINSAIDIFKNNILFGIYGNSSYTDTYSVLRDHNVWFDMLGYFGIIRSIPFIAFLVSWYKQYKHSYDGWKGNPFACIVILWVVFGFLNPVNKSSIQVLLFLVLPLSSTFFEEEFRSDKNKIVVAQNDNCASEVKRVCMDGNLI